MDPKNVYLISLIRKFPVCLPHELFPWLVRNNAWVQHEDVNPGRLSEYWEHFNGKVPWAAPKGVDVHPIYLWGDDVQYNQSHEKLIVVVAGHVLDRRTYSLATTWPLFCIREVSWCLDGWLFGNVN